MVLLPTLTVPIITEIAAERRMYLPLAAIIPWLVDWNIYGASVSNRSRSDVSRAVAGELGISLDDGHNGRHRDG